MTDEQINKAIAAICLPLEGEYGQTARPDYCGDLNAMHDALLTLRPDQLWDVAYSLPMETMLGFMATARQLAETFLMVLGKWEEKA